MQEKLENICIRKQLPSLFKKNFKVVKKINISCPKLPHTEGKRKQEKRQLKREIASKIQFSPDLCLRIINGKKNQQILDSYF